MAQTIIYPSTNFMCDSCRQVVNQPGVNPPTPDNWSCLTFSTVQPSVDGRGKPSIHTESYDLCDKCVEHAKKNFSFMAKIKP